ncbi:MAG: AAA family ATPase [Deltaproteobacteria bacterium]|nr:AAA family ATPase [Deltaproteobacteria bacterium]
MLKQLRLRRFKRFDGGEQTVDLDSPVMLLAGPNNSGKTTVLQAMGVWSLALRRWLEERGRRSAKKRVSITLDELTALPLREANLLWLDRRPSVYQAGRKSPASAPIAIELSGETAAGRWALAMELLYANSKMVHVRPVSFDHPTKDTPEVPDGAAEMRIVHVPAFSGIETEEPRRDPGLQDRLIGQGRPGEVLRNLLWEVFQQGGQEAWQSLVRDVERLFFYELLEPTYDAGRPFILCEYRPRPGDRSHAPLDIASGGSGFHQVLLLLAFFYARPASVLLLDEPDAHLHYVLQREILDHLRAVAGRRGCQLVVSTHSEVLLQDAQPTEVVSFAGAAPRRLVMHRDVTTLQTVLRRLTSLDLLRAQTRDGVLYVEDQSDAKLLRQWAEVLQHPARCFLADPFVYPMGGSGRLGDVKQHFSALREVHADFRGLCILDRDEYSGPEAQDLPAGFRLLRWRRREIENYLIHREALLRYLEEPHRNEPLFASLFAEKDQGVIDEEFTRQGLRDADPLDDRILALLDSKGSAFLVELLQRTSRRTNKRDLYLVAGVMRPEEVHPDVRAMLDEIARWLIVRGS